MNQHNVTQGLQLAAWHLLCIVLGFACLTWKICNSSSEVSNNLIRKIYQKMIDLAREDRKRKENNSFVVDVSVLLYFIMSLEMEKHY